MTLRLKAAAPVVPRWAIRRPALEKILDGAIEGRLTTVVAGPGFGKTTLLASWAKRQPCARWYSLGREDRALATLARGLAEALGIDSPALSSVLGSHRGSGGEERTRAETIGVLLSEALEARADAKVAIVLDDVQELARGSPAARLIETLVRAGPQALHLTLSSRSPPPFSIERLRGRGQAATLEPALLAFSVGEVDALVAASLGIPEPQLARQLHELTSGWPAAVRLALEALRSAPPADRPAVLDRVSLPGGSLFAYLAEEVFGKEPPAARQLLRRVALLERFSPELCTAIGIANAPRTLRRLGARGLFVYPDAGAPGWFLLHGLVRDFVQRSWPLDRGEVRRVHRRAAAWFEAEGKIDDAIRLLEEAGEWRRLARLLRERGGELIASGRGVAVMQSGERLPAQLLDAGLEELLGDAHRNAGELDTALRHFLHAAGDSEALPPRLAWKIGEIHYPSADLEEALSVFARAQLETGTTCDEAILFAYWACAQIKRGEVESAQALATRSYAAAQACGDEIAFANAHTALGAAANLAGDLRAAERHHRRALESADRSTDVRQMIRTRVNLADGLTEEGLFEDALKELDAAVALAESSGYERLLPLALSNRGEAQLGLGRLDQAIADFERVSALCQRGGPRLAGSSLVHLGDAYRVRGDLALARTVYEETIRLGELNGNLEWLRAGLAGLARVLAREDPERAAALAERAIACRRGRAEDRVMSLLAAGWVQAVQGRVLEAAKIALEAAAAAGERQNRPAVAEALELRALTSSEHEQQLALLAEALATRQEIGDLLGAAMTELAIARLTGPSAQPAAKLARRTLSKLGVRATAAGAAGLLMALGPERPVPLGIETLGGFRVLREGEPVPAGEWQSRKARDLLKILVARRGRSTPRDILIEHLWPGSDPHGAANRLAVALSTARGVLDPGHRFEPNRYLFTEGNAVALKLSEVAVDLEEFLSQASAGLRLWREGRADDALELLESAEEAYAGDFLDEDLYEEWASPLREEARGLYAAVAVALAEISAEVGERETAIRYRLRVLERDPYDEGAHLALVSDLVGAGHHGEARRAYRRYVSRMDEIDVEPAPFPRAAAALSPL
jgi:ATP/maltotriose-dependent transcriptional regulator MalT/DNA-binding SARP family transcriptional activator